MHRDLKPASPEGAQEPHDALRHLSALADGEVNAADLDRSCRTWTESASSRQAWHLYHVIGDVMRSAELGTAPTHDEAFLQALRERLAAEPVVLAPQPKRLADDGTPAADSAGRRRSWLAPMVVAAGFATVAGVMLLGRISAPPAAGPELSLATAPAGSLAGRASAATAGLGLPQHADSQLVRDARLDRYFEAHRGAFQGNALGVPGGSLRSVDILLPQR